MLRGLVDKVARHCERHFDVKQSQRSKVTVIARRYAKAIYPPCEARNVDCFALAGLAMTIIVLSGCAIFKTTKKDVALDERSSKWEWSGKSILNSSSEKNSNSLLLRRDSGTNTFSVRIWPKGAFTFSAESGFAGTADSLSWYGTDKGVSTSSSQQQSLEKNKINAKVSVKAKSAERTDRSKTTTETWISWKWIAAAIMGIILILSYVLRRIRI